MSQNGSHDDTGDTTSSKGLVVGVVLSVMLVAVMVAVTAVVVLNSSDHHRRRPPTRTAMLPGVNIAQATVLDSAPSDPKWWTEGLDMLDNGNLLISTGRDPSDRDSVSGVHSLAFGATVTTADDVTPAGQYGEGVAVLPHNVFWQLTWNDHQAYLRTPSLGLRSVKQVDYPDSGWGATYWRGNNSVVTSNGSAVLTIRDATTLAPIHTVTAMAGHQVITGLNELDGPTTGRGDQVWAHVYPSDLLVRISLITGQVTAQVDLSNIAGPQRDQARRHSRDSGAGAPNGLVGIPGEPGDYYLIGKRWDQIYRIALDPRQ